MPFRTRHISALIALLLAAPAVTGCASINEKTSAAMGDYIPHWAGGLPADAPPRPGTVEYDKFMKERERRRLMPAAEREKEDRAKQSTSTSGDAVH